MMLSLQIREMFVGDGECTFDEDVLWSSLVELGGKYIFSGNSGDVILLDKEKLMMGEQRFFHWKYGIYVTKSWVDDDMTSSKEDKK